MRSDPTDTGGLFVGRRPGTAPVRFKAVPQRGTQARQRVGSEINYLTGSVFLGIILAFLALFPMLFGALAILRQLDNAWILVRRAAGHDQRSGVMGRVFGFTAFLCAVAFTFW